MNVIFDISVLAQARRDVRARTGVFRVGDNVARGLVASAECNVSFTVTEAVRGLSFLANDPELRRVSFSMTPQMHVKLATHAAIYSLHDLLPSESPATNIFVKALGKFLYRLDQFAPSPAQIIPEDDLAHADIYHSPFHPIPRQVQTIDRVKKFLTVYDLIPVMYPELFGPEMNRFLVETLNSQGVNDFFLCISQSTKDDLCNYRNDVDPARVFVTHLAASELFHPCTDTTARAAVRAKYGIPEDRQYLLSLCTLEPRKNIEQAVKSFARLVREQAMHGLRLVLVGAKGWDYDRIFEVIESFDIPRSYIILTGYVADEDLAALYSGAVAFIYLSLYEGFGLPPLEAMQCGVPVITSNTSSLPEVVGDAGIMVDPLDEESICQAMFDLYRDAAFRDQMSRRSLARSRQFSWDRCMRETLAAYKIALNG